MAKRPKKPAVDDRAMRTLLKLYACPLPYHQIRARFMGHITTPSMTMSPIQEVQSIWDDSLPEFEDQQEAEAFFGSLLQGMWNGLSEHQKRTNPFKLSRVKSEPASYEYLARFARIRREELEGFIDGLFAGQEEMDMPESTHNAVNTLGELLGMFAGVEDLALNPPGPADVSSMEETAKHLRELSRIAETEINTIIQSCRKARQQMVAAQTMDRPGTIH